MSVWSLCGGHESCKQVIHHESFNIPFQRMVWEVWNIWLRFINHYDQTDVVVIFVFHRREKYSLYICHNLVCWKNLSVEQILAPMNHSHLDKHDTRCYRSSGVTYGKWKLFQHKISKQKIRILLHYHVICIGHRIHLFVLSYCSSAHVK